MADDDELIDIDAACRIIGGKEKPIHRCTYYRGVAKGIYPPPCHPSPGISRVLKSRVIAARDRQISAGLS